MDDLTPQLNEKQLKENIDALLKQGKDTNFVQGYVNNYRKNNEGNYVLLSEMKKGFGKRISEDLGKRQENINQVQDLRAEGETGIGEAIQMVAPKLGAKVEEFTRKHPKISSMVTNLSGGDIVAGQLAGGVQDIISETLSAITPKKWKEWGAEKAQQFAKTALAQAGIKTAEQYADWAEKYPLLAKKLEGNLNLAMTAADLTGAGEAVSALGTGGKKLVKGVVEGAVDMIPPGAGEAVSKAGSTVKPIVESVGATMKSAGRRGIETVKEAATEAKRVSALPKVEKEAVRTGLDEGIIDFVKSSSPENLSKYREVVKLAKESSKSLRNPTKFKEVVGKEILEHGVKPAIKIRNSVGKKIGEIVKSLPTVKEDISGIKQQFEDLLKTVGVRMQDGSIADDALESLKGGKPTKKGRLVSGPGSVVGDLGAYQNMYNRIKSGIASKRDLHDIRQAIFKEFNLAASRAKPFSDDASRVAEKLRSMLAEPINKMNPEYMIQSKKYSETMQKLQDFVKLTTYKGDLEKIGSQSLRVSEIASRILGNASARPQEVLDAIIGLSKDATKTQDIKDLIKFSDLMEDFYGIQQTRSLAGQSARGIRAGVEGATEALAESAANGGLTGLIGRVVKGVMGKTTKEQQRALEALIDSLE